jgi:hypothetical protein
MRTWYTEDQIKEGQIWSSCDGSSHKVTIVSCKDNFVEYSWMEKGQLRKHKKTVFAFQVRYFLD